MFLIDLFICFSCFPYFWEKFDLGPEAHLPPSKYGPPSSFGKSVGAPSSFGKSARVRLPAAGGGAGLVVAVALEVAAAGAPWGGAPWGGAPVPVDGASVGGALRAMR